MSIGLSCSSLHPFIGWSLRQIRVDSVFGVTNTRTGAIDHGDQQVEILTGERSGAAMLGDQGPPGDADDQQQQQVGVNIDSAAHVLSGA